MRLRDGHLLRHRIRAVDRDAAVAVGERLAIGRSERGSAGADETERVRRHKRVVLDVVDNGHVDRGHCRVPRGLRRRAKRLVELVGREGVDARDRAANAERRKDGRRDAADVEERHHVEAHVLAGDLDRRSEQARVEHDGALRERYALWLGGGAGSAQQQRDIMLVPHELHRVVTLHALRRDEPKEPRPVLPLWRGAMDLDLLAAGLSCGLGRSSDSLSRHAVKEDHVLRTKLLKRISCVVLNGGWIERRGYALSGDGEEGNSRNGTAGHHVHDSIAVLHAELRQVALSPSRHEVEQLAVGERDGGVGGVAQERCALRLPCEHRTDGVLLRELGG
mmetsp:Transcript_22937/g.52968  ORF Transcript_22937/g.52968 Transcript_22937/m.52968 type:complete len:335 (+) Transcript_22937:3085-4089(+)